MHPPLPGDKAAGFIGLAAAAVSILVTVYVIVQLTNRKFESHGAAAAHAAPAAGAPAAGAPAGAPPSSAPAPSAPAPAPH